MRTLWQWSVCVCVPMLDTCRLFKPNFDAHMLHTIPCNVCYTIVALPRPTRPRVQMVLMVLEHNSNTGPCHPLLPAHKYIKHLPNHKPRELRQTECARTRLPLYAYADISVRSTRLGGNSTALHVIIYIIHTAPTPPSRFLAPFRLPACVHN